MSSIPSNNSGSASSPPVGSSAAQRNAELTQLLAANAYKNPVGILMTVLASVETAQMQVRQELSQSDAELTQEQGAAAKETAASYLQAGSAEAVGEGFQAAGSAAASLHGTHGLKKSIDTHKEHTAKMEETDKTINEHSEQLKNLRSTEGFGERPEDMKKIQEHEAEKEKYTRKRKEQETQREHEGESHRTRARAAESAFQLGQALSKAGTAVTTAQARAETASAQQTQESLKSSREAVQAAEKNATDVANQAANQDPSRIMTGR